MLDTKGYKLNHSRFLILTALHGNSGCTNASQRYVTRILPVLLHGPQAQIIILKNLQPSLVLYLMHVFVTTLQRTWFRFHWHDFLGFVLLRYLLLLYFGTLGIKLCASCYWTVCVMLLIYMYIEVFESCNRSMAKTNGTKRQKWHMGQILNTLNLFSTDRFNSAGSYENWKTKIQMKRTEIQKTPSNNQLLGLNLDKVYSCHVKMSLHGTDNFPLPPTHPSQPLSHSVQARTHKGPPKTTFHST